MTEELHGKGAPFLKEWYNKMTLPNDKSLANLEKHLLLFIAFKTEDAGSAINHREKEARKVDNGLVLQNILVNTARMVGYRKNVSLVNAKHPANVNDLF